MTVAPAHSRRWLFGPVPDLLLGCGALYGLAFIAFGFAGGQIRELQPPYLLALLALLIGGPHYGGTLLRVYEERENRQKYWNFALYATLLVGAFFVLGVYNDAVAVVFVTVYMTWSPWHYTGQNYGITMMFLRRRGVEVSLGAKRWLYASFLLSYLLTFLLMHEPGGRGDAPVYTDPTSLGFVPLGIPVSVVNVIGTVLLAGYLVTLGVSTGYFLRRASLRALFPAACLVGTQALWFSVPLAIRHMDVVTGIEPLDWRYRSHYILWIAIGHSAQYLWVTTYFARASQSWKGYGNYLGKVALAGTAIWTLPFIAFAPDGVGRLSYDTGLELLVASAVNIHHFILDGAIWKLRDGRIASILIRNRKEGPSLLSARRIPGLRRLIWSTAAILLAIRVYTFFDFRFNYISAYHIANYQKASGILDRLAWFGYDRS